jgi:hypothetical protein
VRVDHLAVLVHGRRLVATATAAHWITE